MVRHCEQLLQRFFNRRQQCRQCRGTPRGRWSHREKHGPRGHRAGFRIGKFFILRVPADGKREDSAAGTSHRDDHQPGDRDVDDNRVAVRGAAVIRDDHAGMYFCCQRIEGRARAHVRPSRDEKNVVDVDRDSLRGLREFIYSHGTAKCSMCIEKMPRR